MIRFLLILAAVFASLGFSCTGTEKIAEKNESIPERKNAPIKKLEYSITRTVDHDESSFTQGLLYHKGYLYESTGLMGKSELKKIDPATGEIIKRTDLPEDVFGEGMALFDDKLYILTYQQQKCLVYDLNTFKAEKEFAYYGEGWGLTADSSQLYMSDGTSIIRVVDPESFRIIRTYSVSDENGPVRMINELEYVNGKIWANRWMYDEIIVFDAATGKIEARADLSELKQKLDPEAGVDVLNGLAYDPETKEMYATGKLWPALFVLKFE